MNAATQHTRELAEARRTLNNLRGVVRRTGTTGWVDRSAAPQYAAAMRAIVALEDATGVDAAYELGQRLDNLRREAMAAGLLTASEVLDADREATS